MGLKAVLKKAFMSQAFSPHPFWGIFANPFYLERRAIYQFIKKAASQYSPKGTLLDFGCGIKPYRFLFPHISKYIGLEYDSPENRSASKADVFYDGGGVPFKDGELDCVLCTQVLEHTNNPDFYLKELYRVMKPGGVAILTIPFMWQQHLKPYDFFRYTEFGARYLIENNNFFIELMEKNPKGLSAIFVLLANQLPSYKSPLFNVLTWVTLGTLINIAGVCFSAFSKKEADLFINLFIVMRKGE